MCSVEHTENPMQSAILLKHMALLNTIKAYIANLDADSFEAYGCVIIFVTRVTQELPARLSIPAPDTEYGPP